MLDLTPVGPGRTVDDVLYDAQRRALRERLICAALTGALAHPESGGTFEDFAIDAIKQADAVLAALDKEAAK